MTLTLGMRFGPYEITGSLGAGGMGEVYRARDTRLGREVAIKTLPKALATDEDRLARFEREAQLLAALNHPHIATIYGLDEHEGTRYLAMELVEGVTLEEKLKAGALPVEDALRLALQIAEALEAAHAKGVIHRDLKPANVMVAAGERVKVLDFGLAKAFSTEPEAATAANSPALSLAMTQAGLILGTAGYMSPEQASGQPTDQRADVWALGVVLYEMLTGLPLFSGESVPHILADVLRAEPEWSRLPKNLHPRIRQMLERCLEKKPRNRYHAIADARVDIEKALGDPRGVTPPLTQSPAAAAAKSGGRTYALAAASALAAVVLTAAVLVVTEPEPSAPLVSRFALPLERGQQFTEDENAIIDLSRDGTRIVYAVDRQIWVRDLDELLPRTVQGIPLEDRATYPVLSPDGQFLLYFADASLELRVIPVVGGTPVTLTDPLPDDPQGLVWHDDGMVLYESGTGDIMRLPATGGTPTVLVPATAGEEIDGSRLLPGGEWVLFTVTTATGEQRWTEGSIVIQSLVSGERRQLVQRGSAARFVAPGYLTYAVEDNLFVVPFDPDTLTVTGGPSLVASGLRRAPASGEDSAAANYAIADNGTLVYVSGSAAGLSAGSSSPVWVDRQGNEEPLGLAPQVYGYPRISPDESRIAFVVRGGEDNVWVYDVARGSMTLLTQDMEGLGAEWSPDGARIAFGGGRRADESIAGAFWQNADGSAPAELIPGTTLTDILPVPRGISPDGEHLLLTQGSGSRDIFLLPSAGGPVLEPLIATPANENSPRVSPDGRWLAYQSDETGQFEVYVRPFPNVAASRTVVSVGGGEDPVWSRDGGELFYWVDPGTIMRVAVETGERFSASRPEIVLQGDYQRVAGATPQYDVSADGQRFLMMKPGSAGIGADDVIAVPEIIVVQNWTEELKRLVRGE